MLIYKNYDEQELYYILELMRKEINSYDPKMWSKKRMLNRIRKNKTFIIYKEMMSQTEKDTENKPIGFVAYRFIDKSLYLALVAFEKSEQHRGFGKQVIKYLEDKARAQKLNSLFLHVSKKNKHAIYAYSKYGFLIDGKSKFYYRMRKLLTV